MKKNREFDRLAHFVLIKLSANFVEQMKVKKEIDTNLELSNKDRRKLYSDIIDASITSQTIVAKVMAAADNNDEFRFSKKDAMKLSLEDVAKKLKLNIKTCAEKKAERAKDKDIKDALESAGKKLAKKMGVESSSVHAIKMSPEAAKKLSTILETISKTEGR